MSNSRDIIEVDHLVIGSGLAGLFAALHLAESGTVAVVTKRSAADGNTRHAQGGIACVTDTADSFDAHLADTLGAGDHLCHEDVARQIIEAGPGVIREMIDLGAHFTTRGELGDRIHEEEFDLGREGGHTQRRVLHAGDITGEEVQRTLIEACRRQPNIHLYEHHVAVDLITSWRLGWIGEDVCLGAYVLDVRDQMVKTFVSRSTTVATGGAGKVYLYTSNPETACGAGIAMCYRAHVPIANMEFFQFHPTILYHPAIHSFLISEALRGEGAVLKRRDARGELVEFMDEYHELGSLAPRDVVARAIDHELKRTGEECVYLDIRNHDEAFLRARFPNIYEKCLEAGIDMARDPIPVVPAAHYCCGGVKTDVRGATGILGLYVAGEAGCTGLHGANRLASNSLLEALVVAKFAAADIVERADELRSHRPSGQIPTWRCGEATDSDELVVIAHNWDEIRRFMWDYVGIFRTSKRLERAKARIKNIRREIEKYYWDFLITQDLVELRNIASIAEIIVDSAVARKESRGLHYNADYPKRDPDLDGIDTVIRRSREG
jgi:L-aspartate oxidase